MPETSTMTGKIKTCLLWYVVDTKSIEMLSLTKCRTTFALHFQPQPEINWPYQRSETNLPPPFTEPAIFTTAKVEAACYVVELK